MTARFAMPGIGSGLEREHNQPFALAANVPGFFKFGSQDTR
jgi:hypothetical protein